MIYRGWDPKSPHFFPLDILRMPRRSAPLMPDTVTWSSATSGAQIMLSRELGNIETLHPANLVQGVFSSFITDGNFVVTPPTYSFCVIPSSQSVK
jgi:hypothetical protein